MKMGQAHWIVWAGGTLAVEVVQLRVRITQNRDINITPGLDRARPALNVVQNGLEL